MLSLQFDQYYHVRKNQGFDQQEATKNLLQVNLPELLEKAAFTKLVDQDLREVEQAVQNIPFPYSEIVVVGLGGSSLGPKAIYEAVSHKTKQLPIYFLDNVDPDLVSEVAGKLSFTNTLFLIITKSGNTSETIALFHYLSDRLKERKLDPKTHCVLITDPEQGYLRSLIPQGYPSLPIPPAVGGRFSVLTNVGLFLSLLLGLDAKKLLEGGSHVLNQAHTQPPIENAAYKLSLFQYAEYSGGRNIHVLMNYGDKLTQLTHWATQLYSESLGKINTHQRPVGFTPHPARGVSDQHSQLQLFQEGPDDKSYLFLTAGPTSAPRIPRIDDSRFTYLENRPFQELFHAEYEATVESLTEAKRPCVRLKMDALDEFHLGAFFLTLELGTVYLGHFLEVNPYDQPGVETSKQLTRNKLTAAGQEI